MAQTPEEKARARLRAQVSRAAAVAEVSGQHEGHWSLHHIALPREMPGDFTRIPVPEYAEEELSPFGELLEYLAWALGPDRAQVIAERGIEAGG
jgi:hypothetical protein